MMASERGGLQVTILVHRAGTWFFFFFFPDPGVKGKEQKCIVAMTWSSPYERRLMNDRECWSYKFYLIFPSSKLHDGRGGRLGSGRHLFI